MTAVDFLHPENPPTWTGVKPATLGADGQRQTHFATQSALAELQWHPYQQSSFVSGVSLYSKFRIEAFTTGSPHTNTIVITAKIESGFVLLKMTWFHSTAVQIPRAWLHSKWMRRWVGVKGSTHNGCRDPKCPSARRLRMGREDTGGSNEGATWLDGGP
ncbi:uncharacterized protein TNCV_1253021 [Trichonephila clavipes]|nr:uncharacterized protein TNCV_1253021 [Trichonephila clavipes]